MDDKPRCDLGPSLKLSTSHCSSGPGGPPPKTSTAAAALLASLYQTPYNSLLDRPCPTSPLPTRRTRRYSRFIPGVTSSQRSLPLSVRPLCFGRLSKVNPPCAILCPRVSPPSDDVYRSVGSSIANHHLQPQLRVQITLDISTSPRSEIRSSNLEDCSILFNSDPRPRLLESPVQPASTQDNHCRASQRSFAHVDSNSHSGIYSRG